MSSRSSLERRPRLLRAVLTALLLVGGMLGEGVHALLQPHSWCELHEALEHHAGHVADGAGAHDADELRIESDAEEAEHDACRLAQLVREEHVVPVAATAEGRGCLGAARPWPSIESRGERSIPLHRLAPKQSPPVG